MTDKSRFPEAINDALDSIFPLSDFRGAGHDDTSLVYLIGILLAPNA